MYNGHHIAYEEARYVRNFQKSNRNNDRNENKNVGSFVPNEESDNCEEPVLILNGFGVGSFHQHRLMPLLAQVVSSSDTDPPRGQRNRIIYGIDYLGQGKSWPVDCDDGNSISEKGLIYSMDTWADQIIRFMEEVILQQQQQHANDSPIKIHLVGNSVGGHLSVLVASRRPDLIATISLLNATPVWGLNLPFWSGHLPPPFIPRVIGRKLFDWIRDFKTIEQFLRNAYVHHEAYGNELVNQIRYCTEGKGGHAAFASILWSPPGTFPSQNGKGNFHTALSKLDCDVLLIFGRNDPWCTPAFAKKMLRSLRKRDLDSGDEHDSSSHNCHRIHRYIELDRVGHCPNHEAPQAVGDIVTRWINSNNNSMIGEKRSRSKEYLSLLDDKSTTTFSEPWGDVYAKEVSEDEARLNFVERILTTLVG